MLAGKITYRGLIAVTTATVLLWSVWHGGAVDASRPPALLAVAASPTPIPTLLPPLNGARSGVTVLTATVSPTGTFFLSTRVNGLRIGLRVPAQAVQQPTLFRVTFSAAAPPARSCASGIGVGNAYDFTAQTLRGKAPVTVFRRPLFLRLDVSPVDLPALAACTIGLAYRHGHTWIFLRSSVVNRGTGSVTATTDHFTLFQVRAVARVQAHLPRLPETPLPRPTVPLPLSLPRATPTSRLP